MKLKLALAALLLPLAAAAQPNFAGKTITIIVGYKPGGGYDATARLMARHLPQHIPGKPTVIVQNMPGGNSIIAANHVYAVAKGDGLTIGTFNRKIVSGYSSSADIMLAVERKEVDGRAGSYSSIEPFIDRKLVHPVIRARSSDK